MPYILKKTKEKGKIGYKVCKRDEPERCFSKHPMSEKKARKQRTAIILSELGRSRPRGGMDGQPGNTNNATNADNEEEEDETTPPATGTPQEPPGAPRRPRATARTEPNQPRMATGAPRALFNDVSPRARAADEVGPSSPPRTRPTSPPRARASSHSHAGPSSSAGYTREMCEKFLQNHEINPLTGFGIKRYKEKFNEIVDNCMIVMGKDFLHGLEQIKKPKPFKKEFIDQMREKYKTMLSPEEQKKKEKEDKKKDEEMCQVFVKNQIIDPKNNSKITIPSKKHLDLYNKCKDILPKELFEVLEKQFIDDTIPKNIYGAYKCKNIINNATVKINYKKTQDGVIDHSKIDSIDKKSVGNPFNQTDSDKLNNLAFEHPLVPLLLEKCENNFLMQIIILRMISKTHILTYRGREVTFDDYLERIKYTILPYGTTATDFSISYDNDTKLEAVVLQIAKYIVTLSDYHFSEGQKLTMLKDLQTIVQDLINKSTSKNAELKNGRKIYIRESIRQNLQSILFEIEALKKGIVLEKSESSKSSKSSDIKDEKEKAKWRSRSLEVPEGLPVLPKKTRDEILEELDKGCAVMMDIFTQEDFEKMKRKKLELIVKIGPKNKENKQQCYYVKGIFEHIKNAVIQKNLPRDPLTKQIITNEEIENIIIPKMKYIDINVVNPMTNQHVNRIPNVKLLLEEVMIKYQGDPIGRPFYKIGYERTVASYKHTINPLGYIPVNIYINEADRGNITPHDTDVYTKTLDISSSVIIGKLSELDQKNLLFNIYGYPRVHINKGIEYWYATDAEIIHRAKIMIDEIDSYLR